jgi:DNA-binding NarL/FixJ family response regulator
MDLVLPGPGGAAATAAIKQRYPSVEAVALTSFSEAARAHLALAAGAAGHLLNDAGADEAGAAVRAAYRGEVPLDSAVARQLTRSLTAPHRAATELTPREREILILVAHGTPNREIARTVVIPNARGARTPATFWRTLGLAFRTQAARWAIREGPAAHR